MSNFDFFLVKNISFKRKQKQDLILMNLNYYVNFFGTW